MIMLKTSYREEYADHGPGRILDHLMFEKLLSSTDYGIMEMYTRASPSDLSWATETRVILDVGKFRHQWIKPLAGIVRTLRNAVRS